MSTAVILAGGGSRRMGSDKLALPFDGATLLDSAVRRYREFFDRVYLSLADASKYPEIEIIRVVDVFSGRGPIAGLHAALEAAEDDGVFLVAADMPFSNPRAARALIELCGDHDACVTADARGRFEPLFGFYKKAVAPVAERQIVSGNYQMAELLREIRTRIVPPAGLGEFWSGEMLMNVNRPEDYKKLMEGL